MLNSVIYSLFFRPCLFSRNYGIIGEPHLWGKGYVSRFSIMEVDMCCNKKGLLASSAVCSSYFAMQIIQSAKAEKQTIWLFLPVAEICVKYF